MIKTGALVLLILVSFTFQVRLSGAEISPPIRIAAASSLRFVMAEIIDAYVAQSGRVAPQVVYGSSGNLFRQISQGAPFDLFVSADAALTEKLENALPEAGTAVEFGVGRLVLFTRKPVAVGLSEFKALLEHVDEFKIAIANPRHAPFGRAAQQALLSLDYWDAATPRLVYAEKVSQAAQFVASGAAEFAVISRSLAVSPALRNTGSFKLIPAKHHQPVVQSIMVLTREKPVQELFTFILKSQSAVEILQEYGLRDG